MTRCSMIFRVRRSSLNLLTFERVTDSHLAVDYVKGFAKFIEGLDNASVKTMEELVDFNREHAPLCLPLGMSHLINGRLGPAFGF